MASEAKRETKNESQPHRTYLPLLIGGIVLILSAITLAVGTYYSNYAYCGLECYGASYRGTIAQIISLPIIAYAISLCLTGGYYFLANHHQSNYKNTHPFLLSLLLFVPICFITVQVFRKITGA